MSAELPVASMSTASHGSTVGMLYNAGRRIEVLTTWYLRFHGYLTAPHFVLQKPDGSQYTDADILGVRFPHSREAVVTGGPDPNLDIRDDLLDVVIAECSSKGAKLNPQWLDNPVQHLTYVLRYIGIWSEAELPEIVDGVHRSPQRSYEWMGSPANRYRVRFICFSKSSNSQPNLRALKKIQLAEMLRYLSGRFMCFSTETQRVRSQHSQWDPFIRELYRLLMTPGREEDVVTNALAYIRTGAIPPPNSSPHRLTER